MAVSYFFFGRHTVYLLNKFCLRSKICPSVWFRLLLFDKRFTLLLLFLENLLGTSMALHEMKLPDISVGFCGGIKCAVGCMTMHAGWAAANVQTES